MARGALPRIDPILSGAHSINCHLLLDFQKLISPGCFIVA